MYKIFQASFYIPNVDIPFFKASQKSKWEDTEKNYMAKNLMFTPNIRE